MGLNKVGWGLVGLVVVELIIFLVSLPGFGIETRTSNQYAPWAGPIFLGLTLLVFVLGIVALVFARRGGPRFVRLAAAQAVVVIATNLFDFSGAGGPHPPLGPLVLGVAALIVALGELALAAPLLRVNVERIHPESG
jgi:hypothetical protein